MAEKALLYNRTHANSPRVRGALVEALEALLASEPAKGADMSRAEGALAAEVRAALNVANGRWYEWGERAKSVEEILLAGLRGYERAATDEPAPPAGAEVRELIERVAFGPCWANRNGMAECKDAFLPKGERLPREFCLRCHAVAVLPALGSSAEVREAEEAKATALLGSARHYFAQGHPMREAIDEHLAALRGGQKGEGQ